MYKLLLFEFRNFSPGTDLFPKLIISASSSVGCGEGGVITKNYFLVSL